MVWNYIDDTFGSADIDEAPLEFFAQNILDTIVAAMPAALTWWNTRWSAIIGYTFTAINAEQCHIGEPTNFAARSLNCACLGEIQSLDNFEKEPSSFNFIYIHGGTTQLAGTKAARYSDVYVSAWYLRIIKSILMTAPDEKFIVGWPSDEPPTLIFRRPRIIRADAKFSRLAPETGVQSLITMDCDVQPVEFNRS